jgi:hypothetical protein
MYALVYFHGVRLVSNVHLSRLDLRFCTLFCGDVGEESDLGGAEMGVGGKCSGLALPNSGRPERGNGTG